MDPVFLRIRGRGRGAFRLGTAIAVLSLIGLVYLTLYDPPMGEKRTGWLTALAATAFCAGFWTIWGFYARSFSLEFDGRVVRYRKRGATQEVPAHLLVEVRWTVNGDGASDYLDFMDPGKRVFRVADVFDPEDMKRFFKTLMRQNSSLRLEEGLRKRLGLNE